MGGHYIRHFFTNTANATIVPSVTKFDGAVSVTRRQVNRAFGHYAIGRDWLRQELGIPLSAVRAVIPGAALLL